MVAVHWVEVTLDEASNPEDDTAELPAPVLASAAVDRVPDLGPDETWTITATLPLPAPVPSAPAVTARHPEESTTATAP